MLSSLHKQVVDGMYAASQRVLYRQYRSVSEVLRKSLERVLKLLTRYWMPVWERSQHCAFRVRSRVALVGGRKALCWRAILERDCR